MSDSAARDEVIPRLMTVEQLAMYLSVSPAWVRKGILNRTLPYTKLGKSVRFTPAQVTQILAAGESPALRGQTSGGAVRRAGRVGRTKL